MSSDKFCRLVAKHSGLRKSLENIMEQLHGHSAGEFVAPSILADQIKVDLADLERLLRIFVQERILEHWDAFECRRCEGILGYRKASKFFCDTCEIEIPVSDSKRSTLYKIKEMIHFKRQNSEDPTMQTLLMCNKIKPWKNLRLFLHPRSAPKRV